FYVISDQAEFVYKCTDYYAPEYDRVILWNDPAIGIDWPLSGRELPLLSSKDEGGMLLKDVEVFS
ncbi:MAG: dTDP-4-dehydrorhamnose 3,5-epimerase, partial [Desulfobacteraceae bacterium]|nr:dTDP-4-dehydrorhamnose 3,5-epimerase [Desulfobacteraceae bacterium]